MKHESDGETYFKWTSRIHPNYSIVEIGQNTRKFPGDLRRLTVTQTPVKKTSDNSGVKICNYKNKVQLGRKGNPLGMTQKIETWPYYQMVYAQTEIRPRKWDT